MILFQIQFILLHRGGPTTQLIELYCT